MAWESEGERALLLELRTRDGVPRRRGQKDLLDQLERMGWAVPTRRSREVALAEGHTSDLEAMLDSVWPSWRGVLQALEAEGLDPTVRGLQELRRRRRSLPTLPPRVNQKTAAAAVAEHSKASLGQEHLDMLAGTEVVRDGVVLVRPHEGMVLVRGGRRMAAADVEELLGSVAISARALLEGLLVDGPKAAAVMTVENEGAFLDLPRPEGLMLVWVPGWNARLALEFLSRVEGARWLHFGDLDPNGVRIYRHLAERIPGLEHFVPAWWEDRVREAPRKSADWPPGLVGDNELALIRWLAEEGRMSEQEEVVLDPRMARELEGIVRAG